MTTNFCMKISKKYEFEDIGMETEDLVMVDTNILGEDGRRLQTVNKYIQVK